MPTSPHTYTPEPGLEHTCARAHTHTHTAPGGPCDTFSHQMNSGLHSVSLSEFPQPRPGTVWSGAELGLVAVAFRLPGETVKKLTQNGREIGGTLDVLDQAACFATMVLATNSKYMDPSFHARCGACPEISQKHEFSYFHVNGTKWQFLT